MASTADALSSLQASDYALTGDIGLQDYGAMSNTGLDAPSFDTPMGVDPFSGASLFDGNPLAPSLTTIGTDASAGTNLYNDGFLPLTNPNPVDSSIISQSQYSGATFTTDLNLPLTAATTSLRTQLGSPTAAPVAAPQPMGASLWANLFGLANTVVTSVSGSAGKMNATQKYGGLTGVKAAPKTAIANPISTTSTALIIGVVASVIGIIIWSFSGAK